MCVGARFAGADLTGASLVAADLREADLAGACLDHIVYDQATSWPGGVRPL